MSQMNPSSARLIDPILTTVARGVRTQKAPVADLLFPRVPVGARGGRIIQFDAEHFRLYNTKRAPGANTKRVQFGYAGSPYALVDYSLEGAVPVELQQEALAVPGIDLAQGAIAKVLNIQDVEREQEAAALALNAASYAASNKVTLAGVDQWSDPTGSDPFGDVAAAKEAIRQQTGSRPDVMVLGPKVVNALSIHEKVLARLRGGAASNTTDRGPASLDELARVFGLSRVVEGAATYWSGTAWVDIWGTSALLAYTTPASAAEMGTPSYGYTYQLTGHPFVEEPYQDRNSKTWYYPVTDARQPVLVSALAGFLISGAAA